MTFDRCRHCDKRFFKKHLGQKFCRAECRNIATKLNAKPSPYTPRPKIEGKCKQCGDTFHKRSGTAFCSKRCNVRYYDDLRRKPHPQVTCDYCGKEFISQQKGHRFCSAYCRTKTHNEANHARRVEHVVRTPPRRMTLNELRAMFDLAPAEHDEPITVLRLVYRKRKQTETKENE